MVRDNRWTTRVSQIARRRDVDGSFLIDFMSLNPGFGTLDNSVRHYIQPHFAQNSPEREYRQLWDEVETGVTELHAYLESTAFMLHPTSTSLPFTTDIIKQDINQYSHCGRTPVIVFLEAAHREHLPESVICEKLKQLRQLGAILSARFRNDSTLLHFAAKKAYPALMEELLKTNIDRNCRDNKGRSALDCATIASHASRARKRTRGEAARAIKSLLNILHVTPDDELTSAKDLTLEGLHERFGRIKERLADSGHGIHTVDAS
jgi:hypothetical protein